MEKFTGWTKSTVRRRRAVLAAKTALAVGMDWLAAPFISGGVRDPSHGRKTGHRPIHVAKRGTQMNHCSTSDEGLPARHSRCADPGPVITEAAGLPGHACGGHQEVLDQFRQGTKLAAASIRQVGGAATPGQTTISCGVETPCAGPSLPEQPPEDQPITGIWEPAVTFGRGDARGR